MHLRFSVLTPVYNPPADFLQACIDSVLGQDYPHLELCLVDDASTQPHVRRILEAAQSRDTRVRVMFRETNGGIVAASNDALSLATGDFVALVDHDDILESRAFGVINHHIASRDTADVDYLYTDEDQLTPDGRFINAFLKPDWSPERLRSQMYTCHLSVLRRSLVTEVGGFRPGFDGSQDYDLVLRATEQARRVEHVPEILYHWRILATSTANNPSAKPYAYEAGVRAVQSHCDRVDIGARVLALPLPGTHRVVRALFGDPKVGIIVPTGGQTRRIWGQNRVLVIELIKSIIAKSTFTNLEFVIVADRSTPEGVVHELRSILGDRLILVWFDEPFNFARKANLGAVNSSGDYLLLLNDDMEVISEDWLETMVGLAQDPTVGVVGAKLLFADGRLQHAGHFYGGSMPHHTFAHYSASEPGPSCMLQIERECSGVTAACALIRSDVWDSVGGMTELLPNSYNDVDLCLKVRHLGYRVVWTPHAQLYHFESMSRNSTVTPAELNFIQTRWDKQLRVDPYGNPALDGTRPDWIAGYC